MRYPNFYDEVEKIQIIDELSDTLGAFEDGEIEFSYLDIVKSAGHSCPIVARAFLMLKEGLKRFCNPKCGEINAYLKDDISEGSAGVISNVIAQVTGATSKSGKVADIDYDPNGLSPNPAMSPLMQKTLRGTATDEEKKEFKLLWQERVERILKFPEVVITVKI